MTFKPPVSIVWLKRDLRLQDHDALNAALETQWPVLLLYVFEPILLEEPHCSNRHWDFIKQSIVDLNRQLISYKTAVVSYQGNFLEILDGLQENVEIKGLYSHQETGLRVTYERDTQVAWYCKKKGFPWKEYQQQGVFRGIQNRKQWLSRWEQLMNLPCLL